MFRYEIKRKELKGVSRSPVKLGKALVSIN